MLLADIFHTCYDYRKCPVNLEEVMIELVGDLLPKNFDSDICEDNEVIHIQVRRSMFLVDDALREGGKKKFVPGKKLKVTKDLTACFTWVIGHKRVLLYAWGSSLHTCITCLYARAKVEFALEGSVDTGGPRREFLRLLAKEIRDGDYFQAGSAGSFFVCNTSGYRVSMHQIIHNCYVTVLSTFRPTITRFWDAMQQSLSSRVDQDFPSFMGMYTPTCALESGHQSDLEDSSQKCTFSCSWEVYRSATPLL